MSAALRRALPNEVRIIGGQWKRSKLAVPDLPGLRPTPDRVRETLFNWLGQDLSGWRCLDAFAGSGALGFEAASRGASSVVMVEPHARAHAALLSNARVLGARQIVVEKCDALEFLARDGPGFDVVFLDPPFRSGVDGALLERIARRLAGGASVYLESDAPFGGAPGWNVVRASRAGRVHYHLLERAPQNKNEEPR